jgi:hypothetical protein
VVEETALLLPADVDARDLRRVAEEAFQLVGIVGVQVLVGLGSAVRRVDIDVPAVRVAGILLSRAMV